MGGAGTVRVLVGIVVSIVAGLAGCYQPGIDPCRLQCSANRGCPDGLACNAENRCAATASARCGNVTDGGIDGGIDMMVDVTPPETTITAMPPAIDNSIMPVFTFTSNEAGTFECAQDGAAFIACTSPKSVPVAGGAHMFQVRAKDLAGNVDGSPATHNWTVDTSLPDTTITMAPAAATQAPNAMFTFTSNDAGAMFECKLDGAAFAACTSPTSYLTPGEKTWNFQVRARNAVGSYDPMPASFTWVTDRTAPNTMFTSTPTDPTNLTSASFTLAANEAGVTFESELDNGGYVGATATFSIGGLTHGGHGMKARATDAAGNIDLTPAVFNWFVDLQGPTMTFTSPSPTSADVTGPRVTFRWNTDDANATYTCDVDGTPITPCIPLGTTFNAPHGTRNFKVVGTDAFNQVTTINQSWVVNCEFPNGPGGIGMFHYNETSGDALINSITTNPNAYMGTTSGAADSNDPTRVAGRFGRALQFTATEFDVATYVSSPLQLSQFTVELWVKPAQGGTAPYTLFATEDTDVQLYQKNNSTVVQLGVQIRDSIGTNFALDLPNTTQDVWHQVTVTYASSGVAAIYLDGVAGPSATISNGVMADFSRVRVGVAPGSNPNPANGVVDAVFWGGQPFTGAQLQDRYCPL